MKGDRFYSVPYDARNDPKTMYVRMKCGGIVAYGRWQALLGILYDQDGTIDLSDEAMHKVIEAELELKGEKLDEFIDVLAAVNVGWIDLTSWKTQRRVTSQSVYEQLHYKDRFSDAGKQGGRGNKKEAKSNAKSD